jgi:hypothetical protein
VYLCPTDVLEVLLCTDVLEVLLCTVYLCPHFIFRVSNTIIVLMDQGRTNVFVKYKTLPFEIYAHLLMLLSNDQPVSSQAGLRGDGGAMPAPVPTPIIMCPPQIQIIGGGWKACYPLWERHDIHS